MLILQFISFLAWTFLQLHLIISPVNGQCTDGFSSVQYVTTNLVQATYSSQFCSPQPYFNIHGNVSDYTNELAFNGPITNSFGSILFPTLNNLFYIVKNFTINFDLTVNCITNCGEGIGLLYGSYSNLLNVQYTPYVAINNISLSGFGYNFPHLGFHQSEYSQSPFIRISSSTLPRLAPSRLASQTISSSSTPDVRHITLTYDTTYGAHFSYTRGSTGESYSISVSASTLTTNGFIPDSDYTFLLGGRTSTNTAYHYIQNFQMQIMGSSAPSSQPTSKPSTQPSSKPSFAPSSQPSVIPSEQPTSQPSRHPSSQPISHPSFHPTTQPTTQPTKCPSVQPTSHPSRIPTSQPTTHPTSQPTSKPSRVPSDQPSMIPSARPTSQPFTRPSSQPSKIPSSRPSMQPYLHPTSLPSSQPSRRPSSQPVLHPTSKPTKQPFDHPSSQPSTQPSSHPTACSEGFGPTHIDGSGLIASTYTSQFCHSNPLFNMHGDIEVDTTKKWVQITSSGKNAYGNLLFPSLSYIFVAIKNFTVEFDLTVKCGHECGDGIALIFGSYHDLSGLHQASYVHIDDAMLPGYVTTFPHIGFHLSEVVGSSYISISSSNFNAGYAPSTVASQSINSSEKSDYRHVVFAYDTAYGASIYYQRSSTMEKINLYVHETTLLSDGFTPSTDVTFLLGGSTGSSSNATHYIENLKIEIVGTAAPTSQPSNRPTSIPSTQPTHIPSNQPTRQPSSQPSYFPSVQPTVHPSEVPSSQPTRIPSTQPSIIPSVHPSSQPTFNPSSQPTVQPTEQPTKQPYLKPTSKPSELPSGQPSRQPYLKPTSAPTRQPSNRPSRLPTTQPTAHPTSCKDGFKAVQPYGSSLTVLRYNSEFCGANPVFTTGGNAYQNPLLSELVLNNPTNFSYGSILFPSFSNIFFGIKNFTVSFDFSVQCESGCGEGIGVIFSDYNSLLAVQNTNYVQINNISLYGITANLSRLAFQQSEFSLEPYIRISTNNAPNYGTIRLASKTINTNTNSDTRHLTLTYDSFSGASFTYVRTATGESYTISTTQSALAALGFNPNNDYTFLIGGRTSAITAIHYIKNFNLKIVGVSAPTSQPTGRPSRQPTDTPSFMPSTQPSSKPSFIPSIQPTRIPSAQPSSHPSTSFPTIQPSRQPSGTPSTQPTHYPSSQPSTQPSSSPSTQPVNHPSSQPTKQPNSRPSSQPSRQPTSNPSQCQDQFTPVNSAGDGLLVTTYSNRFCPSSKTAFSVEGDVKLNQSLHNIEMNGVLESYGTILFPPFPSTFSTIINISIEFDLTVICTYGCADGIGVLIGPYQNLLAIQSLSYAAINTPSLTGYSTTFSHIAYQQSEFSNYVTISCSDASNGNSPTQLQTASINPSQAIDSRHISVTYDSTYGASFGYFRSSTGENLHIASNSATIFHGFHPTAGYSILIGGRTGSFSAYHDISNIRIRIMGYAVPSSQPTSLPTRQPSSAPSIKPTEYPSSQPTSQPSSQPKQQPSCQPSEQPSSRPTCEPSTQPSVQPTSQPSQQPFLKPTNKPTDQPTRQPSGQPILKPTSQPSRQPSKRPTRQPTSQPTSNPTNCNDGFSPIVADGYGLLSRTYNSRFCRSDVVYTIAGDVAVDTTHYRLALNGFLDSYGSILFPDTSHLFSNIKNISASFDLIVQCELGCADGIGFYFGTSSNLISMQQSSYVEINQQFHTGYAANFSYVGFLLSEFSVNTYIQITGGSTVAQSVLLRSHTISTNATSSIRHIQITYDTANGVTFSYTRKGTGEQIILSVDMNTLKLNGVNPNSYFTILLGGRTGGESAYHYIENLKMITVGYGVPTSQPTDQPSTQPTRKPSVQPTRKPSGQPSLQPTSHPSMQPSEQPSCQPTSQPTHRPSNVPSTQPSSHPSSQPNSAPSMQPTIIPSCQPTSQPSEQPSIIPSTQPTSQPSNRPSITPSTQPSALPSFQPTRTPTTQPSSQPSAQPTKLPSEQPSCQPSEQPIDKPTSQPTKCPSYQPSSQPSSQPSFQPTNNPSFEPTIQPSGVPSSQPTVNPTHLESLKPSSQPSEQPTTYPTLQPSSNPSSQPTINHSTQPTSLPSDQPSSQPTIFPSSQPSGHPSSQPSNQPSQKPSSQPSEKPTSQPSNVPSARPTVYPSSQPTGQPTNQPTILPSSQPSAQPTTCPSSQPTNFPTDQPSSHPSSQPSMHPSSIPSCQPSNQPSNQPSIIPSMQPTSYPTTQPSVLPSIQPTLQPTSKPTLQPSCNPSNQPTIEPSMQPSSLPSSQPSILPSEQPSTQPSSNPSGQPSLQPFARPTSQPTEQPSAQPTSQPSIIPSMQPSTIPSDQPSSYPSVQPTTQPTTQPSSQPSSQPSVCPSTQPSTQPTGKPSHCPTTQPSSQPTMIPSAQPTSFPSSQPSGIPSTQPSSQPSARPSTQPSCDPTTQPTTQPSDQPSIQPTAMPSSQPSSMPSSQPTSLPSTQPTSQPFVQPTCQPSSIPSVQPSSQPSNQPTVYPSTQPTVQPSTQPSIQPSNRPSCQPSSLPSMQPSIQPYTPPSSQPSTLPSDQPSQCPSMQPTVFPTSQPTSMPSSNPSAQPSNNPSMQPSSQPSSQPSEMPSMQPTNIPTTQPSTTPSCQPSTQPSRKPTNLPTMQPTCQPTSVPTNQPSIQPTSQPSKEPTSQPSCEPTIQPTRIPTVQPTSLPTSQPSHQPTSIPSNQPSSNPSDQPTSLPSGQPTTFPSCQPTSQPTNQPSIQPSAQPSAQPFSKPSAQPSVTPSEQPTTLPTIQPSSIPSSQPSCCPTSQPTSQPTIIPSSQPTVYSSVQPSISPSRQPSNNPSSTPTIQPTNQPSCTPTQQPSSQPSNQPSSNPTQQPTMLPSCQPTTQPSSSSTTQPTSMPSDQPTSQPSDKPSTQPSIHPSSQPSDGPSGQPSMQPSVLPSMQTTSIPSNQPSNIPTEQPSAQPSTQPTALPSIIPTVQPTSLPSIQPSSIPTVQPTTQPSSQPTFQTSAQPSSFPTAQPSVNPSNQPTVQPSTQPSSCPSSQPSFNPTTQPSSLPSSQPTFLPSSIPSMQPTSNPSIQPSEQPSSKPTATPTFQPTEKPSTQPSLEPSVQPTFQPTSQPSSQPTSEPSSQPSAEPSSQPTIEPSSEPTTQPTVCPTVQPSQLPSSQPTTIPSLQPTSIPSSQPSRNPSSQPSSFPSSQPSSNPTDQPSIIPSVQPSSQPTFFPTMQPSIQPTMVPSAQPTIKPSGQPSSIPSMQPTEVPSDQPTSTPSQQPSVQPTYQPTSYPTTQPSIQPSGNPTTQPSSSPSSQPTSVPSMQPSSFPSFQPTSLPSSQPSSLPSSQPTKEPSTQPTIKPSVQPSESPSSQPSVQPTSCPSDQPSSQPSILPSSQPSSEPSYQPSSQPTDQPSTLPSSQPSNQPTIQPSDQPTNVPSTQPSHQPSNQPSNQPSTQPSVEPSSQPSCIPTLQPTVQPSSQPSRIPSHQPTEQPSSCPTAAPTNQPSMQPSSQPSMIPTRQPSAQPSMHPSNQPSSFPTRQPSTQPTSQPTSKPSFQPTYQPSTQPSVLPSRQPTLIPSKQPTSQPSRTPTLQPTVRPTSVPTTSVPTTSSPLIRGLVRTLHPTKFPSSMPSTLPSSPPTSYPIWSSASAWSEQFVNLFDNIDMELLSNQIYLPFNELLIKNQIVLGGSSGFRSFYSGELKWWSQFYSVQSVSLYTMTNKFYTNDFEQISCANQTIASQIVDRIVASDQVQNNKVSSFLCDGYQWQVANCPDASQVRLCISCKSPCSYDSLNSKVVFPFPCDSTGLCLHALVPIFTDPSPPSPIESIIITETNSTSVKVQITTEFPSVVYCNAVAGNSSNYPTSTQSLILAGNQNVTTLENHNATTILLINLSPSTLYGLYCVTKSISGGILPFVSMINSSISFSTNCCKLITIDVQSDSVTPNSTYPNAIVITITEAPSSDFSIQLIDKYQKEYQTLHSSCILGQTTYFTRSSLKQGPQASTISIVCGGNVIPNSGKHILEVHLNGSSAGEYAVQYVNSVNYFIVRSTVSLPDAPTLTQARMNDIGSSISVQFSIFTNQGELANAFNCSKLFAVVASEFEYCLWTNQKSVSIILKSNSLLQVGTNICLTGYQSSAANNLKASCSQDDIDCSLYPNADATSCVVILPPSNPIKPSVFISGPSVTASCAPLQLTFYSSSGNAGRNWQNVSVSVFSANTNYGSIFSSSDQSQLYTYIATQVITPQLPNLQQSSKLIISADVLIAGLNYLFVFQFCNIFGGCAQTDFQLTVVNDYIPSVAIYGPSSIELNIYDNYTLDAAISRANCMLYNNSLAKSLRNMTISWGVYRSHVLQVRYPLTYPDPLKYFIPAYSLTAGYNYEIVLTVVDQISDTIGTSSIYIQVANAPLIAIITGGDFIPITSSSTFQLDASNSYDSNISPTFQVNDRAIVYSWSCQLISNNLTAECPLTFDSGIASPSPTIDIIAGHLDINTILVMTLTIGKDVRSSNATMQLLPQLSSSCLSTIQYPKDSNIAINPSSRLNIPSTTFIPSTINTTLQWSILGYANSSLELNAATSLSKSVYLGESYYPFIFSLNPNAFIPGSVYTIQLSCIQSEKIVSTSTIQISTNAAPSSGVFYVTPSSGFELDQPFTYLASNWLDADLPLLFSFGFIDYTSFDGLLFTMKSTSIQSICTFQLPRGDVAKNYSLNCSCTVIDNLNSQTQVFSTVHVYPNTSSSNSVIPSLTASLYNSYLDSDLTRQTLSNYLRIVNTVNCTLAPNCTSLHRLPCHNNDHTCGSCTHNHVSNGDANSICNPIVSKSRKLSMNQGSRRLSAAATSFKLCPNDCSDHGQCIYQNIATGNFLSSCFQNDTSCTAVCNCNQGYFGLICDTSNDKQSDLVATRELLFSSIQELTTYDLVNLESVASWVVLLNGLVRKSAEISDNTALSIASTLPMVFNVSQIYGVPYELLLPLMDCINVIPIANRTSAILSSYPNSNNQQYFSIFSIQTSSLLTQYSQTLSQSLVQGLQIELLRSELRLVVSSFYLYDIQPIVAPQTNAEKAVNHSTPVQYTFQSNLADQVTSAAWVILSMSVVRAINYLNIFEINSNPVQIDLIQSSNSILSSAVRNSLYVTLDYIQDVNVVKNPPKNYTTVCLNNRIAAHQYSCPGGYPNISVHCTGNSSTIFSRCPFYYYETICNSLNLSISQPLPSLTGCTRVFYDDNHITCACPFPVQSGSSTHAAYSLGKDLAVNTIGNYKSSIMFTTTTKYRSNTFTSDVIKGDSSITYPAVIGQYTMTSFAGLFIIMIIYVFWADTTEYDLDKSLKSKKKLEKKQTASVTPSGKSSMTKLNTDAWMFSENQSIKLKAKDIQSLVDESLPNIFSKKNFVLRLLYEMKQNHKLFGVVFHYSNRIPRFHRIVILITHTNIVLILIYTFIYFLFEYESECRSHHYQDQCLQSSTLFDNNAQKCGWNAFQNTCSQAYPVQSAFNVISVAIFAQLCAIPLVIIIEYLVVHYLQGFTSWHLDKRKAVPLNIIPLHASDKDSTHQFNGEDRAIEQSGTKSNGSSFTMLQSVTVEESLRGSISTMNIVPKINQDETKHNQRLTVPTMDYQFNSHRSPLRSPPKPDDLSITITGFENTGSIDATSDARYAEIDQLIESFEEQLKSLSEFFSSYQSYAFQFIVSNYILRTNGYKDMVFSSDEMRLAVAFIERQIRKNCSKLQSLNKKDFRRQLRSLMDQSHNESILIHSCHSEHLKSRRLIFLFILDLLPRSTTSMLQANDTRGLYSGINYDHSVYTQILIWLIIFSINAICFSLTVAYIVNEVDTFQSFWFGCVIFWIFFEIFLCGPLFIVALHVLIPISISSQVLKAKSEVLKHFNRVGKHHRIHTTSSGRRVISTSESDSRDVLSINYMPYALKSYHVAKQHASLEVAQWITSFSTERSFLNRVFRPLDEAISQKFKKGPFLLPFIWIKQRSYWCYSVLFQSIHFTITDTMVYLTVTAVSAALCILNVYLYLIHPALLTIFGCLTVLLIGFIVYMSMKMNRVIPEDSMSRPQKHRSSYDVSEGDNRVGTSESFFSGNTELNDFEEIGVTMDEYDDKKSIQRSATGLLDVIQDHSSHSGELVEIIMEPLRQSSSQESDGNESIHHLTQKNLESRKDSDKMDAYRSADELYKAAIKAGGTQSARGRKLLFQSSMLSVDAGYEGVAWKRLALNKNKELICSKSPDKIFSMKRVPYHVQSFKSVVDTTRNDRVESFPKVIAMHDDDSEEDFKMDRQVVQVVQDVPAVAVAPTVSYPSNKAPSSVGNNDNGKVSSSSLNKVVLSAVDLLDDSESGTSKTLHNDSHDDEFEKTLVDEKADRGQNTASEGLNVLIPLNSIAQPVPTMIDNDLKLKQITQDVITNRRNFIKSIDNMYQFNSNRTHRTSMFQNANQRGVGSSKVSWMGTIYSSRLNLPTTLQRCQHSDDESEESDWSEESENEHHGKSSGDESS